MSTFTSFTSFTSKFENFWKDLNTCPYDLPPQLRDIYLGAIEISCLDVEGAFDDKFEVLWKELMTCPFDLPIELKEISRTALIENGWRSPKTQSRSKAIFSVSPETKVVQVIGRMVEANKEKAITKKSIKHFETLFKQTSVLIEPVAHLLGIESKNLIHEAQMQIIKQMIYQGFALLGFYDSDRISIEYEEEHITISCNVLQQVGAKSEEFHAEIMDNYLWVHPHGHKYLLTGIMDDAVVLWKTANEWYGSL